MKYSWIKWNDELNNLSIPFRTVNWIHDEWVTELEGDVRLAQQVGQIQSRAITSVGDAFGLRCPMGGEYKVGKNWLDVH